MRQKRRLKEERGGEEERKNIIASCTWEMGSLVVRRHASRKSGEKWREKLVCGGVGGGKASICLSDSPKRKSRWRGGNSGFLLPLSFSLSLKRKHATRRAEKGRNFWQKNNTFRLARLLPVVHTNCLWSKEEEGIFVY